MKKYQFQNYLNSIGLQHVKFSTYYTRMDSCEKNENIIVAKFGVLHVKYREWFKHNVTYLI
jgi:hypothetical protein